MTKEQKFYKALQDVFIGAKIEGASGFVNLMRIKSNYYSQIEKHLQKDIEEKLKGYLAFKDELFDKLYSFFSRYFTESGSVYFNSTPFHNNIYEKVYTDEKDVILFWKTQMLYYVKTDRIFRSIPVEFDGFKFYFDASELEHKKANEKRTLIYDLKNIKSDDTIVFRVLYSERGKKTKPADILKALKKKEIKVKEEQLEKAFSVFQRQSEVDYFINKNAKEFLREQFKLWLFQYTFDEDDTWSKERIDQLQILKDIAYKIIDFISQFEDELVRIWNKPKFVRKSNYVITIDKLNKELVSKIAKHKNLKEQIKEWQGLGIVDKKFTAKNISDKKYQFLPIDTKYFKDIELEILGLFDNLDGSLDGWLIKSENYQALNTILPKFKEQVQTIYIDPPFNTGDDFDYIDKYKDSSWLSIMTDRIKLSESFLHKKGSFYIHLDERADYLGRFIIDNVFSFKREIIWDIQSLSGYKTLANNWVLGHQTILFATKSDDYIFKKQKQPHRKEYLDRFDKTDEKGEKYFDGRGEILYLKDVIKKGKAVGDVWYDIMSFQQDATSAEKTSLSKELTQKREKLLERIIKSSMIDRENIILDFFLGAGTSIVAAQKLQYKWIGIELGDHYYSTILPRLKEALSGSSNREPCGISKDVHWEGGGFFKYYEIEQYEEALANAKYKDGDLFNVPDKDPYSQYVFMKDEKMLKSLELDYKKNKVKVNLSKFYKDIDIPETLSNLLGKNIKKIKDDEVEFEDGQKINTKELDYKLIKPLIWW